MRKHKLEWGAPQDPTDTRWGKKILALFLSLVMFLSMLPTGAFAVDSTTGETTHTHDDGSWIPIGGEDNKNFSGIINKTLYKTETTEACFYLTENLTWPDDFSSKAYIPADTTATICLNGHTITAGVESRRFAPVAEYRIRRDPKHLRLSG